MLRNRQVSSFVNCILREFRWLKTKIFFQTKPLLSDDISARTASLWENSPEVNLCRLHLHIFFDMARRCVERMLQWYGCSCMEEQCEKIKGIGRRSLCWFGLFIRILGDTEA